MKIRIFKIRCIFCKHHKNFKLEVDSFNELRKLQQLYKCKKCGYRNVKSRSIEQNKMESRTKQLLFSFFVLVFCKYFL